MKTVAFTPFSFLRDVQRDIDRLFAANEMAENREASWMPAADISEDDQAYFLAVDLPGVSSEDVDITAHNGVLTIFGNRNWDLGERSETSSERWRGKFLRRFNLPDHADLEHIEAKYENGVLAVRLPKQESAAPRRITVQ